jgi:hypothetical protein
VGLNQTKSVLHSKINNAVKRQSAEWEKIIATIHLTEYLEHIRNSKITPRRKFK